MRSKGGSGIACMPQESPDMGDGAAIGHPGFDNRFPIAGSPPGHNHGAVS